MSDPSDPTDLPGQLEALTGLLTDSNAQLYRHLALYLQVLRQVLPQRVQQACFHLATQVHPQRYAGLPAERRRLLHGHIEQLVNRCSSLLTVEQLAILADQIFRERQRRERHDEQRMFAELSLSGEGEPSAGDDGAPEALPPGSVQLAMAPPLSGGPSAWGALRRRAAGTVEQGSHQHEGGEEEGLDEDPEQLGRDQAGRDDNLTLARALAALEPGDDPSMEEATMPEAGSVSEEGSLWQQGRLPREPGRVLQWMDGMELAMGRRLRNLSHAINVELLRAGVNRSLLPVSLLDAVLSGQLDTMAAPPNLLRLPLPFGGSTGSRQAQTMAVLLRTVEVELEEPRLRTCRRRLQQHRQEVRRMAQQFRRLQRRLRIHQAEQLWLQDIRPNQAPSD